jgi:hypothetical protein
MDAPAYVDAAASAVGLTIDPRHRPAVIFHVQLAASMAARLHGVPLGPEDESANVFRPVGPEDLPAPAAGECAPADDASGAGA